VSGSACGGVRRTSRAYRDQSGRTIHHPRTLPPSSVRDRRRSVASPRPAHEDKPETDDGKDGEAQELQEQPEFQDPQSMTQRRRLDLWAVL
jgi:hypothetical protein